MNVGMMQPTFLPWQGFFEIIYNADVFVFLDDFQFSVQSYHQRNQLFINKGETGWYSVPVQKSVSFMSPLCRTKINESVPWRRKMWKRIKQNYSKASYFSGIAPWMEEWLLYPAESLASQNIQFITTVCDLLKFDTKFLLSSHFPSVSRRSKRVAELLLECRAERYFCARGSFGYMFEDGLFPLREFEVLFQNFHPRAYRQVGSTGDFVPRLSILDALMNVGPEETSELVKQGTQYWSTWNEMVAERFSLDENNMPSTEHLH